MIEYTIIYQICGKSYRTKIFANSENEARKKLTDSFRIVECNGDIVEHLSNLFGIDQSTKFHTK